MAATVDIVVRHFVRAGTTGSAVTFEPRLPSYLERLRLRIQVRGSWLDLELSGEGLEVAVEPGAAHPVAVQVEGRLQRLEPGSRQRFAAWVRP